MQNDGNFVVYDSNNKALWSSVTYNSKGSYVVMQNDGNLVLYTAANKVILRNICFVLSLILKRYNPCIQVLSKSLISFRIQALWSSGTAQTSEVASDIEVARGHGICVSYICFAREQWTALKALSQVAPLL